MIFWGIAKRTNSNSKVSMGITTKISQRYGFEVSPQKMYDPAFNMEIKPAKNVTEAATEANNL